MTLSEAGITQSVNEPQTLTNLTGLAAKFKNWVAQAWEDIKVENDQSELTRSWFSTTIYPRLYFDLRVMNNLREPTLGELVGQASGCKLTVDRCIITNGGTFANRTAQGYVEFSGMQGTPFPNEVFLGPPTSSGAGAPSLRKGFRFLRFGDWRLDNQLEMNTGHVADMSDVWWSTLVISDDSLYGRSMVRDQPLRHVDFGAFNARFEHGNLTCGTPRVVSEYPSDGCRMTLWPHPDRPYRVSGYYEKIIPPLVNDDDVPLGLKPKFHAMIAWRALSYYGQYEVQPHIVQQASNRYTVLKKKFDMDHEIPVTLRPIRLY